MRAFIVWSIVTAAVIAEPSGAVAQTEPAVEYRYDLALDLSISLASAAITLGASLGDEESPGPTVRSVDDVFVLDRFVARSPEQRDAARHASDAVVVSTLVLGTLASAFSVGPRESRVSLRHERLRRTGLALETLAVTNGFTTIVKLAARRPRPYTYAPGYDPAEGNRGDELSFYSLHAANAASLSATVAYFTFAETRSRPRRALVLTAGTVATLSTAMLRVRAAKHFPTDVTVGVIVGASIGVLVPHLHRRTGLSLSASPVAGGGLLTLSGRL